MRSHRRLVDPAGVAMLAGALVGFVVGAVIGFSGDELSQPVVTPLLGALAGALLGGAPFALAEAGRRRQSTRERERAHALMRAEAHRVHDLDPPD
jgi:hypothetical protein